MFESFREKVPVIFLQSIGGNPEPKYDLERAFAYLPGDEVRLHPTLAAKWIESGVAKAAADVSLSELFDLKLLSR